MYIYRISSTGYSSVRYGNCEMCGKHVTEVHLQVEIVFDNVGLLLIRTNDWFGHDSCLRGIRKHPHTEQTADEYRAYMIDRRNEYQIAKGAQ